MADRTLKEASRRRLIHTGALSAGVVLVAALLVIANYFGWKYHKRFDWTSSQLYSLSEKSKNVLSGLERDIEAVIFLSPQEELYEPVHEILARYDAASPRLSVRTVDPQKNPVEAQQLVQKYQVTNAGVVFASGDDRRVVESGDLAEMDFSGMQFGQQPQMTGFKGEQLFTSAILQLAEGRKPKILFTTGHGEASLDDQSARGLSGAQEILGSDNFDLEEWASLGKSAVPEGADLVVVAGPKGSFVQPELDVFSAYLAKGGRMLVLADPVLGQAAGSGLVPTGLDRWLAGYGVRLGEDIVVDPSNPLPFFGAETIFVNTYGDHPITRSLRQANLPVLMSVVRSAGKGEATGAAGAEPVQLLETSAEGWGETDLARLEKVERDSADLAGPVPLGVVVAPPAPPTPPTPPDNGAGGEATAATKPAGMRLVVFGDSDFATNQLLQANQANAVLLANTLNWLVERETLLGIPPKKTETVRLSLTSAEIRTVYLLSLLALPGLGVALGAVVYFRRRR